MFATPIRAGLTLHPPATDSSTAVSFCFSVTILATVSLTRLCFCLFCPAACADPGQACLNRCVPAVRCSFGRSSRQLSLPFIPSCLPTTARLRGSNNSYTTSWDTTLRHGHHFEPVDFVIDHGRGHHDAYSAGSCQRTYARACGCPQRPRCHREELIETERGWSGREAFVTMMQTADLGQGNDRSGPGRLNGSSIRCVLAERQVGP